MVSSRWMGMIKRETERFLTDEAEIERGTTTINDAGDQVTTWNFSANVSCRLLPEQRRDSGGDIAKREALQIRYRLIMPVGTLVEAGDRFKIGGHVYELVELRSVTTDKAFVEAIVTRIA
jgi:head-tail adaptor